MTDTLPTGVFLRGITQTDPEKMPATSIFCSQESGKITKLRPNFLHECYIGKESKFAQHFVSK
jgi:hypothetical protein